MGYLKDFRESFAKRLDALDPEEMKEALNIACNALLESYRNGQKSAQPEPRAKQGGDCLLYTSPSPRDGLLSRMPSSA